MNDARVYVLDGSGSMLGPRSRMRDALLVAELSTLVARLEDPSRRGQPGGVLRLLQRQGGRVPAGRHRRRGPPGDRGGHRHLPPGRHRHPEGAARQLRSPADAPASPIPSLQRAQLVLVTDGEAPVDPPGSRRRAPRWATCPSGSASSRSARRFAGYIGSAIDVTELKLASVALSHLSRRLLQSHEDERAWIARELNDDLCQRLMGLTLQLLSVGRTSCGGASEMPARIEELCVQLGDLAGEIHAISDHCYSRLKLLGLAASALSFCQELSARHDVTIDFRHDGVPDDLPDAVALALFRVLQEALDNAVRHAAVGRVSVSLGGSRHEIQLDVADQGVGFDPEAAVRSHGLGLISMRERLNLVDGECQIASRPGGGTRILARVPLRRSD